MITTTKPFRLLALAALLLGFGACTDEREGQIDHISASDGALCFSLPPLDGFVEAGTRAAVVPGYEKGDRPWQAGDVVLAKMTLTETNAGGAEVNRYDIYTTLTVPTAAGTTTTTWTVDAGAAVPVMYFSNGGFNAEKSNGDAGYELLKTETDGSISLVPPSGTVGNKLQINTTLYYHPNAKWEKVGNAYQPGGTATPATIAQWKAEAVSNTTTYPLQQVALNSMVRTVTNFSGKAFKAMCHRVRVYTGKPNFLVKLTSTKFQGAVPSASGVAALKTSETTYTALTNAAGNAYFYGITPEVLDGNGDKGFNIFLPNVDIPDGAGFKTEDISIYDANPKAKVDLTFGAKASARAIDAVWALSDDMVTSALIDVSAADINFVPDKLKDKMAEYTNKGKYNLYIIGMDKAEGKGDASATTAALYEAMNTHISSLTNDVTLHLLDAPKVTEKAFMNCSKLGSIDMPEVTVIEDGVTTTSATGAFYKCTSLRSINLPKTEIVGYNAFNGCKSLASVELPSVKRVKGGPTTGAFEGCSALSSINLPQATEVGTRAFYLCTALANVNLPEVTTLGDNSFNSTSITFINNANLPKLSTAGAYAFANCEQLTTIDLPLLTLVNKYLFSGCIELASINLPEVTEVGQQAFQRNEALTSLTDKQLPKLETLGEAAFIQCSKLKTVKLTKLTLLIAQAFMLCSALDEIYLPKITEVGPGTFYSCASITSITSAQLPLVNKLQSNAFNRCTKLATVDLPYVTSVGKEAFTLCPLTTLTFGALITEWGKTVLYYSATNETTLTLNSRQTQNFDINGNASGTVIAGSGKSFGGYPFKQINLK